MNEDKETHKHYVGMSNERIDRAFDIMDEAMCEIMNELHLNVFEAYTVLSMMETKIRRNNIDQYLLETVTRFQEKLNEEDENLK